MALGQESGLICSLLLNGLWHSLHETFGATEESNGSHNLLSFLSPLCRLHPDLFNQLVQLLGLGLKM